MTSQEKATTATQRLKFNVKNFRTRDSLGIHSMKSADCLCCSREATLSAGTENTAGAAKVMNNSIMSEEYRC